MSKSFRESVSLVFDTNFLINYTNVQISENQDKAKTWYNYYLNKYKSTSFCSEIVIAEFDVFNDFSVLEENLKIKRIPFSKLESKLSAMFAQKIIKKSGNYKDFIFENLGIANDKTTTNKNWQKIFEYVKDTLKDDLKILSSYVTHNIGTKKVFFTSDSGIFDLANQLDIEKNYNVKIVNYLTSEPGEDFSELDLFKGEIE